MPFDREDYKEWKSNIRRREENGYSEKSSVKKEDRNNQNIDRTKIGRWKIETIDKYAKKINVGVNINNRIAPIKSKKNKNFQIYFDRRIENKADFDYFSSEFEN
jgi:hypothetical protein